MNGALGVGLQVLFEKILAFIGGKLKYAFQRRMLTWANQRTLLEWQKIFIDVISNSGKNSETAKYLVNSKQFIGLLLQPLTKGIQISTEDLALILAIDNKLGLQPNEIIELATTFGERLNLKKNKKDVSLRNTQEVCKISEIDNHYFYSKLSCQTKFKKTYYENFSQNVKSDKINTCFIKVYYSNEMGAVSRAEKFSIDISVNIFNIDEICPAFFTENAEYELFDRGYGEKLQQVLLDGAGSIKLVFGDRNCGKNEGKSSVIWSK